MSYRLETTFWKAAYKRKHSETIYWKYNAEK